MHLRQKWTHGARHWDTRPNRQINVLTDQRRSRAFSIALNRRHALVYTYKQEKWKAKNTHLFSSRFSNIPSDLEGKIFHFSTLAFEEIYSLFMGFLEDVLRRWTSWELKY